MKQSILKGISGMAVLWLLVFLLSPVLFIQKAQAASLQEVYIRLDRIKASTATTGLVCAKTAVADVTESNVVVTFPTGFSLGLAATFTVNTSNPPPGATGWLGIGTATDVTGQVVTFPSSNLTANTLYCFNWTNTAAVTTATAGDDKAGTIASGGNSSSYALSVISDDQIVITAVVPPIFGFALSGNTDTFSDDLSPTAIRSTTLARTVTIDTNADNGWVTWVKSANAGLNSASTGGSIATAGTVNNTPEDLDSVTGYVLDVDITSEGSIGDGDVTQASDWGAEYAGADATQGGSLSTTFQPIAASDGTSDADILTLIERAKITSVQIPATDYTDTLTVVAAGRF